MSTLPHANYAAEDPAPQETGLNERVAALHISYTMGNGKVCEGSFRNQILTNRQRIEVDMKRAQLSGGVSYESMAPGPYALLYAICWLEVSIVSGPDWTKNLMDCTDEGLVGELWKAANRHEDTFHGRLKR